MRVRTPRPDGGCHQCCTSPSTNCRLAHSEQVLAQQRGLRVHQRHRVLQLVAEAEGAARLVVAAARPDAAGERLVQQPAVGQQVERRIGRLHLHRAERVVPVRCTASSASRSRRRRGSAARAGRLRRCCGPCRGGTRSRAICPCASSNGTWIAAHGSSAAPTRPDSRVRRSAAGWRSEPLRPMNSARSQVTVLNSAMRFVDVEEADPVAEVVAVAVARVERAVVGARSR